MRKKKSNKLGRNLGYDVEVILQLNFELNLLSTNLQK